MTPLKANDTKLMDKILITGASGFIGSFIVEEALKRGMEVWAAVRTTSSHRYLQDERIHFIDISLGSYDSLCSQLNGHRFDYVVHAAGVTKCNNQADFYRINTLGTENLVWALKKTSPQLKRFVYLSSLSVMGPVRENEPHTEIEDTDTPRPNTNYARSKLKSEEFLSHCQWLPWVILRPTGVYGPREHDYFLMAQSIKRHVDFAAGYKRQDITFVYVTDVVQAVFLALEKPCTGHSYFLTDGSSYTSTTFSDLIRRQIGNPWMVRVKAPLWVLRAVTTLGALQSRLTGKATALNNDKYNILKQRNWLCNIEPARRQLGYNPRVGLEEGVEKTIAWYKKEGWL